MTRATLNDREPELPRQTVIVIGGSAGIGFETARRARTEGAELNQLHATLPIRRVVGPADVAALTVHIITNTALTGATYDVNGGQQLVAANEIRSPLSKANASSSSLS